MPQNSLSSSLLPADVLQGLHNLPVIARTVVDGLRSGTHRSRLRGQSVDFADHRPYVPGDDTRHLDWKVLARNDRLVLKRFESERDLAVHICLDTSASMSYQGKRALGSKFRYAQTLAACIAHLAIEQGDRLGLYGINDGVTPQQESHHAVDLNAFCQRLEAMSPDGGAEQLLGLQQWSQMPQSAGLVVVISDAMCDLDMLATSLQQLRQQRHDVVLLWTLDPDEQDFGVDIVARFEGLELGNAVMVEPRALRDAYRAQVERHRQQLHQMCQRLRVVLVPLTTDLTPQIPLNTMLVQLHQ